jgi:hypothetical protein
MALPKTANASVITPGFGLTAEQGLNRWDRVRVASKRNSAVGTNLIEQASGILERPFDPGQFLLTHATIVASVDVFEPSGVKTGSVLEDGFRVNRKYGDYRVKPETDRFINNNLDAWSRPVLVASYPTFIGAHNFVEHVQIEEQSKGRIIDAVARDIGDSVYVDILIATDRNHDDLVRAIENGKMGTLSMGCTVDGTICTRCGHWAADETEMCPHVKYGKGNKFFDNNGRMHRVAELCGHESISPQGGVHFIEASWVATPAFTGAVLRNVLEPTADTRRRAQEILSMPPVQWDDQSRQKAAFDAELPGFVQDPDVHLSQWGEEGGEEEGGEAEKPPESDLKKVEDDLTKHMLDRVRQRVEDEMTKGEPEPPGPGVDTSTNETLVKEGASRVYQASLNMLVRTASTDVHLIDRVAALNESLGIRVPVDVYRAVLKTGGAYRYATMQEFLRVCHRALGRQPNLAEAKTMVRLGKLISRRGAAAKPPSRGETTTPGTSQGDQ